MRSIINKSLACSAICLAVTSCGGFTKGNGVPVEPAPTVTPAPVPVPAPTPTPSFTPPPPRPVPPDPVPTATPRPTLTPRPAATRAPASMPGAEYLEGVNYWVTGSGERVSVAQAYAMAIQDMNEHGAWLSGGDRGTLTRPGMESILAACGNAGLGPRDCAGSVASRSGPFEGIPQPVADEAALLLRTCSPGETLEDCADGSIAHTRYIRDQNVGLAEPTTLDMVQYERANWLVNIKASNLGITPGQITITAPAPTASDPTASEEVSNAIIYDGNTCFTLEYNPEEFEVAEDRVCPQFRQGTTPYTASWSVRPLKSGRRQLSVMAHYSLKGKEFASAAVPTSPFMIDVRDWKVVWFEQLEMWQKLLGAIGAIITTILGWKIWSLLRRRKKTSQSND